MLNKTAKLSLVTILAIILISVLFFINTKAEHTLKIDKKYLWSNPYIISLNGIFDDANHLKTSMHRTNRIVHFSARTQNAQIQYIVLHHAAAISLEETIQWCLDANTKVSAHYVIDKDGSIHQFVDEKYKAWHAGLGSFAPYCALNPDFKLESLNNNSIGIVVVNNGYEVLTQQQIDATDKLCSHLRKKYHIKPHKVIHNLDWNNSKIDISPYWPAKEFANRSLGIYPAQNSDTKQDGNLLPEHVDEFITQATQLLAIDNNNPARLKAVFLFALRMYGYDINIDDIKALIHTNIANDNIMEIIRNYKIKFCADQILTNPDVINAWNQYGIKEEMLILDDQTKQHLLMLTNNNIAIDKTDILKILSVIEQIQNIDSQFNKQKYIEHFITQFADSYKSQANTAN